VRALNFVVISLLDVGQNLNRHNIRKLCIIDSRNQQQRKNRYIYASQIFTLLGTLKSLARCENEQKLFFSIAP
jgi:hypothetical protein